MKIGVLGGGQLARMLALAAYPLGIELLCIDPNKDACANPVTRVLAIDFASPQKIDSALQEVDVLTYETENLPFSLIQQLSLKTKLQPNADILRITQDRYEEKSYLNHLHIPTTPFRKINALAELEQFIDEEQCPVVLKTRLNGYDGKGQMVIRDKSQAKQAFESFSQSLIVEKFLTFDCEVSLIAARDRKGEIKFYPLTLNQHEEGILAWSEAPFIHLSLQNQAQQYAQLLLENLNYIGVIAIEFFCVGETLLVNEVAPRVHNSGHWTIEGAVTSQFENHIRAISGLPLGSTDACGFSCMINCVGQEPDDLTPLLQIEGLHYHTYGKKARPKRKLGHMTIVQKDKEKLRRAREEVRRIYER